MKLYDNYSTCIILIGISFFHILALSLCAFCCYRFLFKTYDPAVWVLLVMLISMLIVVDIQLLRGQIYRFLVRSEINKNGIICRCFCKKSWYLPWNKICTYGITGYAHEDRTFPIIFFSLDSSEMYEKNKIFAVNQQRVVFQMREEIWHELSKFMPDDMKKQLRYSIDNQKNCFCKRRAVN